MEKSKSQNIRLGLFIVIGTLLLISTLYFIGSGQNLFGKNFKIKARFDNVNGLMAGNNVRFSGIDVGTVESVEIIADNSVMVVMLIEEKSRIHIKKNAIASIGTDGLMGNKLINISPSKSIAETVEDGDELQTQAPIDLTDAMQTLNSTNKNLESITNNLVEFTNSINAENSLWSILSDSTAGVDVRTALGNFKKTSENSVAISRDLKLIAYDIQKGQGTIGVLLKDTNMVNRLNNTMTNLEFFSDSILIVTADLSKILGGINSGQGTIGGLMKDTLALHNLNNSLFEIENAARSFDENMKALKKSWPFKKYYKKKEKEANE